MMTGLRSRVLAAVLLTAMIPLAIASSQGYHCAREAVLALVESHLHSVLQSQENLVTQWIENRESDLRLLAKSEGLAAAIRDSAALEQVVESLSATERNMLETFLSVTLTSAEGLNLPIWAVPGAWGENRPDGEPAKLAHFEVKVGSEQEDEAASLSGTVDLQRELIPVLMRSIDPTATVYLIPSSGGMVTVGNPAKRGITEDHVLEALHAPLQQTNMTGYFVHGHRELNLLAATALSGSDWVIGAALDAEAALHWLDVLVLRAIWMAGATLILVVILSLWISGTLAKPLRRMAEVADRIRGGNRDAAFDPSNIVEIEEVQLAIRQMLQELRQQERQLIQAGALAMIGELTSRVVHEMRNPLSSIKLNLQAFYRQSQGDEVTVELTHISLKQVDRLERMFTELLQYGRPIELQPAETTFGAILGDSLRGIETAAREKNVHIECEDQTLGTLMEVDPEQMRRVLTNLLENAIQASPSGATVRITGSIKRGAFSRLRVAVQDEGSGFTGEAQRSLFKPFFTTKPGGVGLGLANVLKIVELHGGRISAIPGATGGAVFAVELPLRQNKADLEALMAEEIA